jgi:uroporphyrinogen-III synthase
MKMHDDIASAFSMLALITRPRDEAEALSALLADRGIETVIEPIIEIVERNATLAGLTGVQAVLCTSANGVRALARASGERGVPVFAVGDATAREARAAGFCAVESADGNVDDLARLVGRRLRPADGKLLHAAGSDVAGDLAALLGMEGFAVERAVLYEARAVSSLTSATARLIEDGAIDVALFFSPRTAAIFVRLVEAAGIADGLAATVAVSISRAADAALGSLPFREHAVAAAPTQAALLELIDELGLLHSKVPT